jgi:hypothetical protein
MAGLTFVDRKPTQPARVAIRVKYMAVPKWFELRTPTVPIPWTFARRIASSAAFAAAICPIASWPSISARAPPSMMTSGFPPGSQTLAFRRAAYQGRRNTPCD